MTIFHVIKYSNKPFNDVLNELDLTLEERHAFWSNYYNNFSVNIYKYMREFLLNYEDPE